MRDGADPPDQATFDAAFADDDPYATVGDFERVDVDVEPPVGFPGVAGYYVAVTMAEPDDPFLAIGPRPFAVRLLTSVTRLLRLHYLLVPSDYVPPPAAVEAAVTERFVRGLDQDAVGELIDREEARLRLEDSVLPEETIRAARELPVGVCVVQRGPDGEGMQAEFGYYGGFRANDPRDEGGTMGDPRRSTAGSGSDGPDGSTGADTALPSPPTEFPNPPDEEYHVSDVQFEVGYYVPVDVRRDVVWYPDSLAIMLTFPDGERCRVDANLRHLVGWWARIEGGRSGLVPAAHYYHRITHQDDAVVVDLSDWQGGSERVVGTPGPRLAGSRDDVLDFLERLLGDVFEALAADGVDARAVATHLAETVDGVGAEDLRDRTFGPR